MDNREILFNHIDTWSWAKQATFCLILCEESYQILRNSKIKDHNEVLLTLLDLQKLCWKFLSHEKVTLFDIDVFLSPEGARYSDGGRFTNLSMAKHKDFVYPQLAHSFYVTISTAGFIGNSINDFTGNKLKGGGCYVGNVGIDLPIDNALEAGTITPAILKTFGIDPSLDLSSYIARE